MNILLIYPKFTGYFPGFYVCLRFIDKILTERKHYAKEQGIKEYQTINGRGR
jgi:hypothetical protein